MGNSFSKEREQNKTKGICLRYVHVYSFTWSWEYILKQARTAFVTHLGSNGMLILSRALSVSSEERLIFQEGSNLSFSITLDDPFKESHYYI